MAKNVLIFLLFAQTLSCGSNIENQDEQKFVNINVYNFMSFWHTSGVKPDKTAIFSIEDECVKLDIEQDSFKRKAWIISKSNIIFFDIFFPSNGCSFESQYSLKKNYDSALSGIDFSMDDPTWKIDDQAYSANISNNKISLLRVGGDKESQIGLTIFSSEVLDFEKHFGLKILDKTLDQTNGGYSMNYKLALEGAEFKANDVLFFDSSIGRIRCVNVNGKDVGLSYLGTESTGGISVEVKHSRMESIEFQANDDGQLGVIDRCYFNLYNIYDSIDGVDYSRDFFATDIEFLVQ